MGMYPGIGVVVWFAIHRTARKCFKPQNGCDWEDPQPPVRFSKRRYEALALGG